MPSLPSCSNSRTSSEVVRALNQEDVGVQTYSIPDERLALDSMYEARVSSCIRGSDTPSGNRMLMKTVRKGFLPAACRVGFTQRRVSGKSQIKHSHSQPNAAGYANARYSDPNAYPPRIHILRRLGPKTLLCKVSGYFYAKARGPCTYIVKASALKYLKRDYILGAKVYLIWVHGPLGCVQVCDRLKKDPKPQTLNPKP